MSLAEIMQEALHQTAIPMPLDLSIRTHPSKVVNTNQSYPLSPPQSCPTSPNTLGSRSRSNIIADSAEVTITTSTTCGNSVEIAPKFPPNPHRRKATRPFKAYATDPMSSSMSSSTIDPMMGSLGNESAAAFTEIRSQMLNQFQTVQTSTTNANMKTTPHSTSTHNPMSSSMSSSTIDPLMGSLGKESAAAFTEFRTQMLNQFQTVQTSTTNPNMKRTPHSTPNPKNCDPAYLEKRRRNNESARKSRRAKQAKVQETTLRAAFLETDCTRIKFETQHIRNENMHLQFKLAHLQAQLGILQNQFCHRLQLKEEIPKRNRKSNEFTFSEAMTCQKQPPSKSVPLFELK